MGLVWVAENEVLDVHVAIKLLSAKRGSSRAKIAKRMLQEARTAAQLGHPAICRALDFGETARGDPFVVTELMHGETLADRVESKIRIPATEAVRFLLPIIDGLSSAHARGIVHRDVKPDNIFLAHDLEGRVQPKLLDFGVARFIESDTKLTLDGALLGTPSYMSPEQARGKGGVDARSDVWSVCVVMYEAITGKIPFDGEDYNAVLWAVVNETPTSIVVHGAGDDSLWRVLQRGLQKDPKNRWQSIWELGEALALWAYERDVRDDVCGTSLRTTWLESSRGRDRVVLPDSAPPRAIGRDANRSADRSQDETLDTDHPGPLEPPGETLEGKSVTERLLAPARKRVALAVLGTTLLVCGVGIGLGLSADQEPVDLAVPAPLGVPSAGIPRSGNAAEPIAAASPSSTPDTEPLASGSDPEVDAGVTTEAPTRRRPAAALRTQRQKPPQARPAVSQSRPRKTVDDHELGF
jgi:serine/threonine protein kinase